MRRLFIALCAFLAFAACSADEPGDAPQDSAASSAPVEPAANATPLREGNLKTGTYDSGAFQPSFTFELPQRGWVSYATDLERFLLFALPPQDYLIFLRPLHVYDPDGKGKLERVPSDLIDWLSDHPDLSASAIEDVSIGGLPGRYVDVTVADAPRVNGEACGKGECVSISPSYGAGPPFHLLAGEAARFYVLDSSGEQVMIVIESSPDDFEEFSARAEAILDSIAFAG